MTEAAVVIEQDGEPTHVVVPFAEWRRAQELLADLGDADEAVRSLAAWRPGARRAFPSTKRWSDSG